MNGHGTWLYITIRTIELITSYNNNNREGIKLQSILGNYNVFFYDGQVYFEAY